LKEAQNVRLPDPCGLLGQYKTLTGLCTQVAVHNSILSIYVYVRVMPIMSHELNHNFFIFIM